MLLHFPASPRRDQGLLSPAVERNLCRLGMRSGSQAFLWQRQIRRRPHRAVHAGHIWAKSVTLAKTHWRLSTRLAIIASGFETALKTWNVASTRFIQTDAVSARWLRHHVRPGSRVPFLGHMVFRVEGGLVDRRMRWPLGDRLRREGDIECSGPECRDASDILVREDMLRLNEIRGEAIGAANLRQPKGRDGS